MAFDQQLRIPGPTPVPHRVAAAGAQPMINHRGPVFKQLMITVLERLKNVFQTKNTILALTGSGTAAMEASVANLINPMMRSWCWQAVFSDNGGQKSAARFSHRCMFWNIPGAKGLIRSKSPISCAGIHRLRLCLPLTMNHRQESSMIWPVLGCRS